MSLTAHVRPPGACTTACPELACDLTVGHRRLMNRFLYWGWISSLTFCLITIKSPLIAIKCKNYTITTYWQWKQMHINHRELIALIDRAQQNLGNTRRFCASARSLHLVSHTVTPRERLQSKSHSVVQQHPSSCQCGDGGGACGSRQH